MSIVNLVPDVHAARLSEWTDAERAQPAALMAVPAWLGLGSNLGDRAAMLRQAVEAMRALPDVVVDRCSGIYETEPWGNDNQGPFLNCVVAVRTTLPPGQLLDALLAIERKMGRVRAERNGPRSIDIDILLYGMEVIDRPGCTIPHPALTERNFVLQPLRELAPDVTHPVRGLTIAELARRCPDTGGVVKTDIQIC